MNIQQAIADSVPTAPAQEAASIPVGECAANIPFNLTALARLADAEPGRYAMSNVKFSLSPNHYRAEATCGRLLGIVTGRPKGLDAETNIRPGNALIERKAWLSIRDMKTKDRPKEIVLRIGEKSSTVGAKINDSDVAWTVPTAEEKRFPDTDIVMKRHEGPTITVRITPSLMAKFMEVAGEFCDCVTMEIRSPTEILIFKGSNGQQEFTGALMPIT